MDKDLYNMRYLKENHFICLETLEMNILLKKS